MPDEQGITLDLVVIIGAAMGGGIAASLLRWAKTLATETPLSLR